MYDFYSSKKVRKDGKCLSKRQLAFELAKFNPYNAWDMIYDCLTYAELRDCLINYLVCTNLS